MDNCFLAIVLEKIPAEDWLRNLPKNRTIMLLKTSKRIINIISKIRPKTYIKIDRNWWDHEWNFLGNNLKKKKIIENKIGHLETLCRIVKLDISNCQMGHNESNNLYEILIQCNDISNLNLRMNFFGIRACENLTKVIQSGNLNKLRYLNLSSTYLCTLIDPIIIILLQLCNTLYSLDLSYSLLSNDGAIKLSNILSQFVVLEKLDLLCNQIRNSGGISLLKNLPFCNIKKLNLIGNDISTDIIKKIEYTSPMCVIKYGKIGANTN
jgi:Ran GTPase-activating protein (RanGAP) involved in mRNA processing and transport